MCVRACSVLCIARALTMCSEAKVLARIQKAVARSPAAAAASTAAADGRVPLPTKFKIPTAAPTSKVKATCFDLWDKPIESFTDVSKVENLSRLPRGITSGVISHAAAPLKSSHSAARIPHPGASYRPSVDAHQVRDDVTSMPAPLNSIIDLVVAFSLQNYAWSIYFFSKLRLTRRPGSDRHRRSARDCEARIRRGCAQNQARARGRRLEGGCRSLAQCGGG